MNSSIFKRAAGMMLAAVLFLSPSPAQMCDEVANLPRSVAMYAGNFEDAGGNKLTPITLTGRYLPTENYQTGTISFNPIYHNDSGSANNRGYWENISDFSMQMPANTRANVTYRLENDAGAVQNGYRGWGAGASERSALTSGSTESILNAYNSLLRNSLTNYWAVFSFEIPQEVRTELNNGKDVYLLGWSQYMHVHDVHVRVVGDPKQSSGRIEVKTRLDPVLGQTTPLQSVRQAVFGGHGGNNVDVFITVTSPDGRVLTCDTDSRFNNPTGINGVSFKRDEFIEFLKSKLVFTDHVTTQLINPNERIQYDYTASVYVRFFENGVGERVTVESASGTPSDYASFFRRKDPPPVEFVRYTSNPDAYSELKQGTIGSETFEAMAGTPTTRPLKCPKRFSPFGRTVPAKTAPIAPALCTVPTAARIFALPTTVGGPVYTTIITAVWNGAVSAIWEDITVRVTVHTRDLPARHGGLLLWMKSSTRAVDIQSLTNGCRDSR